MSIMSYMLIGLGISIVGYGIYRQTFLKNPKKDASHKPHFTLKIETE
ncbi:MAG: hypothetical protein PHI47_08020 [Sulfuricurvum sp.]|nr:hypothetical protein [Sulfuricurvum sp.]MDD5159980.1 hypothetical protein [Sulfuricurvum sp.]